MDIRDMSTAQLRAELFKLRSSQARARKEGPLPQKKKMESDKPAAMLLTGTLKKSKLTVQEPIPPHCKHPKLQLHPSGEVEVKPGELGVKVFCPDCQMSYVKWVLQ